MPIHYRSTTSMGLRRRLRVVDCRISFAIRCSLSVDCLSTALTWTSILVLTPEFCNIGYNFLLNSIYSTYIVCKKSSFFVKHINELHFQNQLIVFANFWVGQLTTFPTFQKIHRATSEAVDSRLQNPRRHRVFAFWWYYRFWENCFFSVGVGEIKGV